MTRFIGKPAAVGLALAFSAAIGAMSATFAQEAVLQETALVKPIGQYFIGDVFPRAASEASAETGRSWRESADDLNREAEARIQAIATATTAKRSELQTTKRQLSEAKKERDLVRIGTLEGTIKNEELLIDILDELTDVSRKQIELAQAWGEAGSAMERYTTTDMAFDPFRTRRLTRPETGQADERLGADGVQAFRVQARAMAELGETFRKLGDRAKSLSKERLDLLEMLAKGGHVQAAR